jgi:hypothetical protein
MQASLAPVRNSQRYINDTYNACVIGVIDTGKEPNISDNCPNVGKKSKSFLDMFICDQLDEETGGDKFRYTVSIKCDG